GPEIERLIQLLARLPGLGPRSARRAALHLIKKRDALMSPLSSALQVAMDKIVICKTCGNIDTQSPCTVCTDARRDRSIIVVVAAREWRAGRRRARLSRRGHACRRGAAADRVLTLRSRHDETCTRTQRDVCCACDSRCRRRRCRATGADQAG